MINRKDASTIAQDHIRDFVDAGDPLFSKFPSGQTGEPVTVYTVWGEPSYWLVPYRAGRHVIGFVRIAPDGSIISAGLFCRDSSELSRCPKVVTGITEKEAIQFIEDDIRSPDEEVGPPLFVHDGPVGREVWLVPIASGGNVLRWLFVNRGGIYERPAGTPLDEELE